MINEIIGISTVERGFRITMAFLIMILYGSVTYVYATQEDIKSNIVDKADKDTISEMLKQTREMLTLQQNQAQFYMTQIENTRRQLSTVEIETTIRLNQIETEQVKINRNLEKLINSVDNLSKKIE